MKKKYIVICTEAREEEKVHARLYRLEGGKLREAGTWQSKTEFKAPEGLTMELRKCIREHMLQNAQLECSQSRRLANAEPSIVQLVHF